MAESLKYMALALLLFAPVGGAAAESAKWSPYQVSAPAWRAPAASPSSIGQILSPAKRLSGAAPAFGQLSPALHPLRHTPRQFTQRTIWRAVCSDGAAPRRECSPFRAAFDVSWFVEALLRPPAPETHAVLKHFGVLAIEGAPPVAYLDSSPHGAVVPYPVLERHLRHTERRGLR